MIFDIPDEAVRWLREGEKGVSSKAIFSRLTGLELDTWPVAHCHPSDPADLRRCVLLLESVPVFAARFKEMQSVSPIWAKLVEEWPALIKMFDEEAPGWRHPNRFWVAPKTYAAMRAIIEA